MAETAEVKIGDKVQFPFKREGTMEGVVVRVHPKSVVIRADFPNHPGKLVRRKKHELGGEGRSGGRKRAGFFARLRGKG